MSTATFDMDTAVGSDDALQYRALHVGAVIGFVFAVFMLVATLIAAGNEWEACIAVSVLNLAPLGLCLWSLSRIRQQTDVYTGWPLAMIGMCLSLVVLIGGVGFGAWEAITEVPDGYIRTYFGAMKPTEQQESTDVAIPPEIAALDGKKIFIKGYIRPDSVTVSRGIKRFLLVRDNNQCCFGDLSTIKYYDQIDVEMVGSRRVDYDEGVFKIGGVLRVEPENLSRQPMKPVFSLQADYSG